MAQLTLQQKLNMANKTVAELMEQNNALKTDYAELQDDYTEVNKEYKDLLDKFTEVTAENHALKAEIERTNRHINLAENQLNKEQQPLVVNHYHNCVINK
jgi:chromosome segregation ATPase